MNVFFWVIPLPIKALSVSLLQVNYSSLMMFFFMSLSFLMLTCLNLLHLLVNLLHPLLILIFPPHLLYLLFKIIFRITPLLISPLLLRLLYPLISLFLIQIILFSQPLQLLTPMSLLHLSLCFQFSFPLFGICSFSSQNNKCSSNANQIKICHPSTQN